MPIFTYVIFENLILILRIVNLDCYILSRIWNNIFEKYAYALFTIDYKGIGYYFLLISL